MPYKILIIGAHYEEIEAEIPNTAAALALAGCDVHILNPIGGWNWNTIQRMEGDGRARVIDAATKAATVLGCKKTIWDYPIAQCHRYQTEILDRMIDFLKHYNPDIVLIHWPLDMHADHRLIAHISRHAVDVTDDISMDTVTHLQYMTNKEVYAFQTGITQAYHFIPDVLVAADDNTMAIANKAIEQFNLAFSEEEINGWKWNVNAKTQYWGGIIGQPAEGLKFLGPQLPLEGFLLKKILGAKLLPSRLESFYYRSDFEL